MALQMRKETAGLPDNEIRRMLGYSTEQIAAMDRELSAQVERDSIGVM
jgi:hypothetical protein